MAFAPRGGGTRPRTGRRFGGGARSRTVEEPTSVAAARTRAVGMLSRRDYPSRALKGRLSQAGFETEAAEEAVAGLEDERLVDDERYVESAVASRSSRGQGPVRIAAELRQSGVAASLIAAAVDARDPRWGETASALRRRRFGAGAPADAKERNRQVRFLLYRGFTGDHVRSALGRAGTDLEDDLEAGAGLDEDAGSDAAGD